MRRRLLVLFGLAFGCSPVGGSGGALGGDNFGGGTSGGAATSPPSTDPFEPGSSSSVGPAQSTGGGETGEDDSGGSTTGGDEEGFTFGPGLYVSEVAGADSNDGSPEAPMRTIQWALQEAQAQGLPAVYVASGTYLATHDDTDTIELRPGISLFGGFSSADWDDRDPALHLTEIVDASVSTTGVTDLSPHRAIDAPLEITDEVVVDGFTVTAAGAAYASAIVVEGGSPTFSNNVLQGQATASVTTVVRISGGMPTFTGNVIDPVGATSTAYGVRCDAAQPRFIGNDIHSGTASAPFGLYYQTCDGAIAHNVIRAQAPMTSGTGRGLDLRDSSPDVLSNSISAEPASGYTSYHAYIGGISAPRMDNNNFVQVSDLGTVYCIYASSAQPSSLSNNNFDCEYLYYGGFSATTLLELEQNLETATDNVAVEPSVMDALAGDLRLRDDGTVACALSRGGAALAGLVPEIDRQGAMRTEPWSIGAFELDGDCR